MLDFLPRLEPLASEPLYAQLAAQLRDAIRDGRLGVDTRLPGSRALADALNLSRNTVNEAYAVLSADGYLVARPGSGTFVGPVRPDTPAPAAGGEVAGPAPHLSRWARRLQQLPVSVSPPAPIARPEFDFRPNAAAWDAFPYATWRRLAARAWRETATPEAMGYGDPAGWRPLREAIAEYLGRTRGVRTDPARVVIVNGSTQSLDLLARLCLDPGDTAVIEEPGFPTARRTLAAYGARLRPVPVDADGLVVDALPGGGAGPAPRLVYVTPSHQYPTGATLSPARRKALLEWAAAHNALVLEDDYDSEFRYAGRPVESMQGLDATGRVVYLGTFSKVLFPSLRLGFVVLPPALVEPFLAAKDLADRESSRPEQRVLARFIEDGHFERHVRRMRRLYATRRAALLDALQRHAAGLITAAPAQTGLSLLAYVSPPGQLDEARCTAVAARAGVGIYPAGHCWHTRPAGPPAFLLGFAGLETARIEEGVRRLVRGLGPG